MSFTIPSPTAGLIFVGSKLGSAAVKAACTGAVVGRLTPEILGEALVSSSSVRGHLQAEALQFVALRISMRSPQRVAWLISLLSDCLVTGSTKGSASEVVRRLGRRAALAHVTAFGMKGTVASAIAALVVQTGMATCQLASSNAQLLLSPAEWRLRQARRAEDEDRRRALQSALEGRGPNSCEALTAAARAEEVEVALRRAWEDQSRGTSLRQYRYSVVTAMLSATGTVVGSGVGAALGSCVMPGFGTILGSMVTSFSVGYLPAYVRDGKGPDDRRLRQVHELRRYEPLGMADATDGFVELVPPHSPVSREAVGGPTAPASVPAAREDLREWQHLMEEGEFGEVDSVLVLQPRQPVAGDEAAVPPITDADEEESAAPATVRVAVWALADYLPSFLLRSPATEAAPSSAAPVDATTAAEVVAAAEDTTLSPPAGDATPPTSSEWSEVDDPAVGPPAMGAMVNGSEANARDAVAPSELLTVLGGRLELLPARLDWGALDKHIDQFGEEELVLVFRKEQS